MIFFGMTQSLLMTLPFENETAEVAIIGGSGMQDLEIITKPKYVHYSSRELGVCSAPMKFGTIGSRKVVFFPRHGIDHEFYPHQIPYAANMLVLKKLGVKYIISTSIAGSLKQTISPGHMVIPDQFVDYSRRDDKVTFGASGLVHCPMANPYCNHLRERLIEICGSNQLDYHPCGTVAVIDGPRFNTISESKRQQSDGCDLVNMTQYPEVYYARLLGMCYANISAITDYDVGIESSLNLDQNNWTKVLNVFNTNIKRQKDVLYDFLNYATDLSCNCAEQKLKPYFEN